MINELKTLVEQKGGRLEVVSIGRLETMRAEIGQLEEAGALNGFQQWIVNRLYKYSFGKERFERRSVIIAAVPFPASYANVTFHRGGKAYTFYATVAANFAQISKTITDALKKAGYASKFEGSLPLKRLAVQSGLAEYGRNNITYVKGLGSYLSYTAYSSDMPCEEDHWRDVTVSPVCENCAICVDNCPTGAIRNDVFLLDNEKCLSAMNEDTRDFPEWLPRAAHHTPFDCLKCQTCCPINAKTQTVIDLSFDAAETERVLAGKPYTDVSKELKKKISLLRLDSWRSIPRNLQTLFDLMDQGHVPSL